MWTRKKLLIWGTTYPQFSKSYYETVCTGALDGESGEFVRIYPITLRYSKEPFRLYDWVEADVMRNTSDFRPESHKINQDTIKPVGHIDTKDGWAARSELLLNPHNVFRSVEALQEAELAHHTSLGLVKPKAIKKIYARWKPQSERVEWEEARESALAQRELFVDAETKTQELEFVPIEYHVKFTCDDPACTTEHDLTVLDWGLYVLHRHQFRDRGGPEAERQVIAKLTDILNLDTHDSYLFLGNSKAHCRNFSIVGIFYPPKRPPQKQMSLF